MATIKMEFLTEEISTTLDFSLWTIGFLLG
jgi:hypothetical protein